jgi:glucan-binding YG repeat protein
MDSDYNTDLDAEYWWYYFGSDGKAYTTDADKDLTKTRIKTINGLKYAFDEEGHMLYGWIDKTTKDQQDDNKQAWMTSQYYFNGWNDGHMATGWQKLTVENSDGDEKNYWFYFGTDGVKVADKTKKIDGKKYHFKADGNMVDDWVAGTNSGLTNASASFVAYVNGDGSERKNKWVWAVPDEDWDKEDYDDDNYRWFYFGKDGKMYHDEVKKINGKKYAFDEHGEMMKGFVLVTPDTNYVNGKTEDADKLKRDDFFGTTLTSGDELYYFSDNEEKDGAMKKGYQKIELDDGTYQFYFDAKDGKASNGYVSKIKKFVANGLVMQPTNDDDSNYMGVQLATMANSDKDDYKNAVGPVVTVGFGANNTVGKYLVSKNGSIVTNKTKLKDSEDNYYVVNPAGVVEYAFSSEEAYNNFFKITKGNSTKTATLKYDGMTLKPTRPDSTWDWDDSANTLKFADEY